MFYPQPLVGSNTVKSDIESLSEQFIRGDVLSTELSEFVFSNIARTKQGTYTDYITQIKQILSYSKIDHHYDLMIIKSSAEIAEDQKAVLVRYINLCVAHQNKIIVFNSNVVYIPEDLKRKYGEEAVNAHVNSTYRDYINKRKTKYIARRFSLKRLIPFLH